MLSTLHDDSMIRKSRRRRLAREGRKEINKPKMIEDYNMNMGGVNKSDQLLSYYSFSHRTVKWWKRAAFHLFEISLNCYILYKLSSQSRHLTHKQFLVEVAKQLVERGGMGLPVALTHQHHLREPPPSRLTLRHFPAKLHERQSGKPCQLDCCLCSNRKGRGQKTTTYMCKQCVVPCFELYHSHPDPNWYSSIT